MNEEINEYKGLSKAELALLSRAEYENVKLITGKYVQSITGNKNKSASMLSRLAGKGRLLQISRGKYFIVPLRAPKQMWSPNEFVAAKYWVNCGEYYIGYFTMYNYWGFTEQIPQTLYILNTKKTALKNICGVQYKAVKIRTDKYFGTTGIDIEGETVLISDKERTLVDFIYNPIGDFNTMKKTLSESLKRIDKEKFIDYLIRYPETAVRKRAGYIMQESGISGKKLERIKNSIAAQNTTVVLNPFNRSRKGRVEKEWGLIIND